MVGSLFHSTTEWSCRIEYTVRLAMFITVMLMNWSSFSWWWLTNRTHSFSARSSLPIYVLPPVVCFYTFSRYIHMRNFEATSSHVIISWWAPPQVRIILSPNVRDTHALNQLSRRQTPVITQRRVICFHSFEIKCWTCAVLREAGSRRPHAHEHTLNSGSCWTPQKNRGNSTEILRLKYICVVHL
jgi:hypothetical protein